MGLLSIFRRRNDDGPSGAASAGAPADDVQRARTRARQRLIGAVVLVLIGIVGFPLVFETQPRPIPVDISIEVPRKDSAAPLTMPAPRAPPNAPSASPARVEPAPASAAKNDMITESRAEAGREVSVSPPASAAPPLAAPVARAASVATPAAKPVVQAKPAAPPSDDARVKALLEGKPVGRDEAGRFVVQVGAFADAGAARETRLKVEKLGLKTYTQVASTAQGERIRVRVGPFSTRDEADKALAKARTAGLTAVVLTL
jgi:DedD protein